MNSLRSISVKVSNSEDQGENTILELVVRILCFYVKFYITYCPIINI